MVSLMNLPAVRRPRRGPEPGSGEWWRDRLTGRLERRKPAILRLEEAYDGDHKMAFASPAFRQTFGPLFEEFSDNWLEIVVQSAVERLSVQGFRFGEGEDADDEAWRIWQHNNMDAEHLIGMEMAVKLGTAYAVIGDVDGRAVIHVEHPLHAITESAVSGRRDVAAGMRRYVETDGTHVVIVTTPGESWTWRGDSFTGRSLEGPHHAANALGVVPMVPIRNNPRLRVRQDGTAEWIGASDIEKLISLNNAIDKTVMDMLVASEYAGYRQRWVAGMETPRDPVTGEKLPVDEWKAMVSRVWFSESPDTKFGDFNATDLNNYVAAATMLLQHLSAQSRTPPHYLVGQIVNASGDALKAAETGLVSKVQRKQRDFGDDWEQVMRIAFLVEGDRSRAADLEAETIWADPESRSVAESTDAALKLKGMGVPLPLVLERAGWSPKELQRLNDAMDDEMLRAMMNFTGGTPDGDPLPSIPGDDGADA